MIIENGINHFMKAGLKFGEIMLITVDSGRRTDE